MASASPTGAVQHYRELVEITRLITSSLDDSVVLDTVTKQAVRLLQADAAVLLLQEQGTLKVAAVHNLRVPAAAVRLPLGTGMMAALRDLGRVEGLAACVGVPLVVHRETIGVLAVYRRALEAPFEHDEELMAALADQAAIALANARVYRQSKAQADALRESEERFRLALDEAPIGVALVGLDGRFLRVNNVLCEIVGYSREELTSLTFQDITHPDDVGVDVALAQKLARREIPRYQLAKRYIRKDGASIDVLLSGSVVLRPDGTPLYYIAHVEDITVRKRAEAMVRQAQERYELALEGADLAAWDWNIETGEVIFNARWAEMGGGRLDEIRPHVDSWSSGVHPEDLPRVQRALTECFDGRIPSYESEHRVRTRSGEWLWVFDRGKIFARDEGGRPIRMVGTELDITERKRNERELARLFRRLQVVLEEAPVGIMLTYDGRTWQANGRAQALFDRRIDPSIAPSSYLDAILDADERPVPDDQFPGVRAVQGEKLEEIELRLRRPDGRLVPVLVNAAPIPGDATEPPGAVVAFEDLTAQKELERLRAEWSSVIAHDLRQPLSSITLSAEMVAEQAKGNPAVEQRIQQIRHAARRLHRMVQDLLDFSQLEASKLRLEREVVELSRLVSDVSARLGLEAPDRHLDVRVRGEPVFVNVDPDRLEQILENLLTNAIKYGDPGTPILVEVAPVGDAVGVSVTNLGVGIPADQVPHLFQRFHTIEEARRLGVRGIGLGLYITRALVEAHGGRIAVESTPGGATTFRFTLPVVERVAAATEVWW